MKKTSLAAIFAFFICASTSQAGFWDDFLKSINPSSGELTLEKTIAGLKEALSVGSGNAVTTVGAVNGYFKNPDIKILVPEKIQDVAELLRKVGYGSTVDEFVLSMNQAAEKAAPKAKSLFIDAIKQMTFEDAKKILNGGDTSATEYLQSKTFNPLSKEFAPLVSSSLDQERLDENGRRNFLSGSPGPMCLEETEPPPHDGMDVPGMPRMMVR